MTELSPDDTSLLAALADGATLRSAALSLGLPRSTVSKRLAAFEARLGERVFVREGRRLVPTRLGAVIIERAADLVEARSKLLAAVSAAQLIANEQLVVAVSSSFAELALAPVISDYRRKRPKTTVELRMTHDHEPLVENGIDIAIRRGKPGTSTTLVRRRLGRTTLVSVAAPHLLQAKLGNSEDAWRHLPFIRVGTSLAPFEMPLSGSAPRRTLIVRPSIAVDSQRLARELVLRGAGVARLNEFLVKEDLEERALVEVSPAARSKADAVALFPRDTRDRPVVRDFLNLLIAYTRGHPLFDSD
ncbi:MAG: LysR family transcriptional regulator [Myxococcota bacterium]